MANRTATCLVREALAGSGIDLVGSCDVAAFDASAPEVLRSSVLLPGARGVVVAASAGATLWSRFQAHMMQDATDWARPHPLDRFVAGLLARADAALEGVGIRHRRFEAALQASPRLDFIAMARLVGLGSPGPFGMLIHQEHGPWWALRGAWLVDAAVDPPFDHRPPCVGCAAPCVGGWQNARALGAATVEARSRCVVGQASRYDHDQIAYHYDREATVARRGPG